jgi:hypothetical protein
VKDQDEKLRIAKEDPQVTQKKEHTLELHDLKPTKDVTGGAAKPKTGEKRIPNRTVEVDFMGWD